MILNHLTLHNVGTFRGTQSLDLTPPDDDHPVILIGGLNGAGKTTVLEAIQLALYGPLLRSSSRGKGSYERYLRGLIHRGVPSSDGAAVELEFTAHQQGQEHRYWIRRSWKPTGSSLREILLVSVDGRHDAVLTENWQEYVETFLPRGIAGLFFFDGEQIEALADLDRSREVLRSALDALLGLDLVTRLSTDLTVLRKRHQSEQLAEADQRSLDALEASLSTARQTEHTALEELADVRILADRSAAELAEAEERYRDVGGLLAERREEAEAAASQATASRKAVEEDLRTLAGHDAPLLLVRDLLRTLRTQAAEEERAARNRVLVDVLDERDADILQWLMDAAADASAIASVKAKLEGDRAGRSQTAVVPVTGLDDASQVSGLLEHVLPSVEEQVIAALNTHASAAAEVEEAERVLASVPHADAVAPAAHARDAARQAHAQATARVTLAEAAVESARIQRERASALQDKHMNQLAHAQFAADDDQRVVHHVTRVQETLERVREAATRRQLARIAALVLEALQMLLRKDRLITNVTVDPATTSVELLGSDGVALPAGDLSAGERQLLAVALLWGLARASGQPLPVVIDTPLGRLDRSHRDRLLTRYFPYASHQVILLSTDTEIDETSRERLHPHIGREYRLVFEDDATAVEQGYFWGTL